MSPTINDQQATTPVLKLLYSPIEAEMGEVEQILRAEMRSEYPFVDELVRYGCMLGGKRLRPALLLLSGKAVGRLTREHLVLGAVVEMIHTATLVHDDVLDEADVRRHLATVNSRWDSEASILLGDFLFTHAFYLASTLETPMACRVIGQSTNIVCEGEIRQKGSRSNYRLTEDEYIGIVDAKTAELCACCCRLGAHYAGGGDELVERMSAYGRYVGIAFQIADDLLDILGDEQTTGKSLGTDLDKQKPTLPLIRVMQLATEGERAELESVLSANTADRQPLLASFYEQYNAIQYARDKAHWHVEEARRQLSTLGAGPERDVLERITEFVVARMY